ncbi:MAG: Ca2+-transporting ATPase [Candidatus Promineifilaceae bacterium]|jgi:Ca2+-transporting ATPase
MENWHLVSLEETLTKIGTDGQSGLSSNEINQRLAKFGPNELVEKGQKGPLKILWEQLSSVMVAILIAAAVISGLLGKPTETIAISAIVLLFAILGFVQEYRAEQAMTALKKLAVPVVQVIRDSETIQLSARELVPGDLVLLEAGNMVPTDLRLTETINLRLEEAALTGESEPVEKQTNALHGLNLPLGDRLNMAYMGTVVTYGRGKGVVIATGMQTELGKIATLIQNVEQEMTPLQQRLDQLGKRLAAFGVVVAALIMLLGILRGETISDMFLTAVSVAVAVIPEGLPAVVTVTLALGAQRMLKKKALIRKLPAVETLGSVTVICSDKTGTLTENKMTVTIIDVAGHFLELMGLQDHPAPTLSPDPALVLLNQPNSVNLILAGGALCNDASLKPNPETGRYLTIGDPTEGALLFAASQAGISKSELQAILPRIVELPFDSDRKRMTTVHQLPADRAALPQSIRFLHEEKKPLLAITKGSADGLLDICTHVWINNETVQLDSEWRQRIQTASDQMAQNGMRVLGLAIQWLNEVPTNHQETLEKNLIFVGMVGMIDPPRPEVKAAIQTCQAAGIRTVMITGDHPLTARFIAHDLGISVNGRVKTGQELSMMSAAELEAVVDDVSIYARVSPEHKLKIVEALQNKGHIVSMTGDGINDSPALTKANIGVAMGITGADVTKEAAQMILLDDNFATIVSAIEEGRVIYDNIQRFIKFSIAGNLGKVIVMLFAPFLGVAIALLPLQLLWLNLLTDGLLGLGLGMEPAEKETMAQPPRSTEESLLNKSTITQIVWVGALIGTIALSILYVYYNPNDPADRTWQTVMFTTLAFLQIGQGLASRSNEQSFFKLGLRSNLTISWLAVVTIGLQFAVVYIPVFSKFFNVTPLSAGNLAVCAVLGSIVFIALEIEKLIKRNLL